MTDPTTLKERLRGDYVFPETGREAADRIEALEGVLEKAATRFDHCATMIAESFWASGTLRAERIMKAEHYALEARDVLKGGPKSC